MQGGTIIKIGAWTFKDKEKGTKIKKWNLRDMVVHNSNKAAREVRDKVIIECLKRK